MRHPRDETVSPGVSGGVRSIGNGAADATRDGVAAVVDRLGPVLIARYGHSVGHEILAEVRAYAWEHRAELAAMGNPGGYLYRVGQSVARRYRRWERSVVLPPERDLPGMERSPADDGLHEALARLQPDDRTVVVLVHSYGYRYAEVAELLGWTPGSVRNRLSRAMARLRLELGEEHRRAHD